MTSFHMFMLPLQEVLNCLEECIPGAIQISHETREQSIKMVQKENKTQTQREEAASCMYQVQGSR